MGSSYYVVIVIVWLWPGSRSQRWWGEELPEFDVHSTTTTNEAVK